MSDQLWSRKPPTEKGWYWVSHDSPGVNVAPRHLGPDCQEGGWPDSWFIGPRLPSPEELAALRECAEAAALSARAPYYISETFCKHEEGGPRVVGCPSCAVLAALRKLEEARDKVGDGDD